MENKEKSSPSFGTRIGTLLAVIVGLALIGLGSYLAHRQIALQFRGIRTQAEVTGVTTHDSDADDGTTRTSYHAFYRFTALDGKTYTGNAQVEQEFYDNTPKTIEILYDPADPSMNAVPGSAPRWIFPFSALAAGFIILVFGLRDKTAGPWIPLEKKIPSGVKLAQSGPKAREWLVSFRRPGGVLLGICIALGWNLLVGVGIYVCLKSQAYLPLVLMSPLILIGVLMLLGIPATFVAKCFPVFEICLDREPRPGERATLFWRCLGFCRLLGRLVISLDQGPISDQAAIRILDCSGSQIKEGQVEFMIPDQCSPSAWYILVEGKRLIGPDSCQRHPIPGTKGRLAP